MDLDREAMRAELAAIDLALSGMMTGATGESRVAQIERLFMRLASLEIKSRVIETIEKQS